jgi:hypothetical protein
MKISNVVINASNINQNIIIFIIFKEKFLWNF